ncbi:hypothetical protein E2C01_074658 [Portunus trituberculatus]|uniref:Uncharacterized protein n=1 Tax=Portunus trituberculatus TaxID=210409 RepID=A0A5B7I3V3_PORTR|nr:hypothetical protein [Portunus trituberculatus]
MLNTVEWSVVRYSTVDHDPATFTDSASRDSKVTFQPHFHVGLCVLNPPAVTSTTALYIIILVIPPLNSWISLKTPRNVHYSLGQAVEIRHRNV